MQTKLGNITSGDQAKTEIEEIRSNIERDRATLQALGLYVDGVRELLDVIEAIEDEGHDLPDNCGAARLVPRELYDKLISAYNALV